MSSLCERHAIVWGGGDARISFMVKVAIRTIAVGLQANGFVVSQGTGARRLAWMVRMNASATRNANTTSGALIDLRDGRDVMVWVGIWDLSMVMRGARKWGSHGVTTVFYNTESHELWDPNCTIIASMPFAEIWQYTHGNMMRCPSAVVGKVVRYIPPGYLPRERMASTLAGTLSPLRVYFLGGNRRHYDKRRRCLNAVSSALIASVKPAYASCSAET